MMQANGGPTCRIFLPRDKAAQELGEEAMRLEDATRELELRAARAKHDAEEAGAVAEKMAKVAAELAADTRKVFQVRSHPTMALP